jgi:hypothetical protein
MGEYVKILGSPADVISTASLISGAAEALQSDMGPLISSIQALESPSVIGGDEFATEFRKAYEQSTPTSATESGNANLVTQDSGRKLGEQALTIGNAASGAMTDYLVQDGLGEADIRSIST